MDERFTELLGTARGSGEAAQRDRSARVEPAARREARALIAQLREVVPLFARWYRGNDGVSLPAAQRLAAQVGLAVVEELAIEVDHSLDYCPLGLAGRDDPGPVLGVLVACYLPANTWTYYQLYIENVLVEAAGV